MTQVTNRSGMSTGSALGIRLHSWWRPPQNVTARFRFLPGGYENFDGSTAEYFMYVEHFVKRSMRGLVCSRDYRMEGGELVVVGGKCLACEQIDKGAEDISCSLRHVFNGIHMAHFHLEQASDAQGRPITKKDGSPAYRKVLCEGRRCQYCQQGLEKVFGKKVHWSVGSGHLGDLSGALTEIEKDCRNCGGRNTIIVSSYECGQCAAVVIDMNTTTLKDEEIVALANREHTCRSCGHKGLLLEQLECSGCRDPEPLSVFDCDLDIKRTGEGAQSTVQIPRWTPTELSEDMVKDLCKPWPFKQIFRGDSFEIQAKVLKIANPYGEQPEGQTEDYENTDEDIPF